MLSPTTLAFLARYTCPRCQQPLGRFHAYPLLQPSQVISLTSEIGPMHLACAEEHAEDVLLDQTSGQPLQTTVNNSQPSQTALPAPFALRVIAVVKTSTRTPSGRLVRLHPEDPATSTLRLFTPDAVHFHHVTHANGSQVIRPARNEEVFEYMKPAIEEAARTALPGTDEHQELLRTLGLIQKRWMKPDATKPERSESTEATL